MPTLHQQIVEKFLGKLTSSKEFDAERIAKLRAVLADSKKLKADELVKVFVESGGDIK
jgi:hypothetical protein